MELGFIIALILVIPVMLIPVALIWYINIGGIYQAIKDARKKKIAGSESDKTIVNVRGVFKR